MVFSCDFCQHTFKLRRNLAQHIRTEHNASFVEYHRPESTTIREEPNFRLKLQHTALRGYLKSYILEPCTDLQDATWFLNHTEAVLKELTTVTLTDWDGMKLFMSLKIKFSRASNRDEYIASHFNSSQHEILSGNDINIELRSSFDQILTKLDAFINNGSDWVVDSVLHLNIHIAQYQVLRGGNSTFEKLPPTLQAKKAIINVVNDDERCFMWSILAAIYPQPVHAERIQHYTEYATELKFDGILFPVKLKDINKFEKQNNISVNVFGFEDNKVLPYRTSDASFISHVDLMLYKGHYTWVKNLDKLLNNQRKNGAKKFFCPRCLLPQYRSEKLTQHLELCRNHQPTRVEMPKDNVLKFRNYHRAQRAPYVIYADFEALLLPVFEDEPSSSESYTTKLHHHIPCGYGFCEVFQCCDQEATYRNPFVYRGEDCGAAFLGNLIKAADDHIDKINSPKLLNMTTTDWQRFHAQTQCSICGESLSPFDRVKDHCHFCGCFRGAAHSHCNLAYRSQRTIPVIFHNLKRYDAHIIMENLGLTCKSRGLEIECIAKTMEEYISFSVSRKAAPASTGVFNKQSWKLLFLDSFQFLTLSLEGLVANLRSSGDTAFKALTSAFPNNDLLLQKGIYPYEYMDYWDKFNETSLPAKKAFFSSLSGDHITDEAYSHAQKVWSTHNITNLGQYHDLYLKTDVLLLCDVFENFRKFCLHHYKLDPAHYLTLPSFGWDACLRMSNVELQLLTDPDMYAFFETGIRGGISVISHRYAKANNKYLPSYDEDLPTSFILYMDMNNLYGSTMIRKLPVDNFRWLTGCESSGIDWKTVDTNAEIGYVLEVDLTYPPHLHASHSDYPVAPESVRIDPSMLSPYCRDLKAELEAISGTVPKLVPNLGDKQHYIVHFVNLKMYLQMGLQLKHIHRAVCFNQRAWMKPYIDFNTSQRKLASSEFEKDLFKLLNNAVFGKSMENVRGYSDVKLVTSPAPFKKLVANPRYKCSTIFNEDLVGVSMHKKTVCLCKPIYTGFTILDLSKALMFEFHYKNMTARYGEKAKLCLTDTDSFIYHIETDDVYDDIAEMQSLFDTSNYPPSHRLFATTNKKVLGKMKDELGGIPIEEFVGLRSKMYSLNFPGGEKMRAKGVKRATLKRSIRHDCYKKILGERAIRRDSMTTERKAFTLHHETEQDKPISF